MICYHQLGEEEVGVPSGSPRLLFLELPVVVVYDHLRSFLHMVDHSGPAPVEADILFQHLEGMPRNALYCIPLCVGPLSLLGAALQGQPVEEYIQGRLCMTARTWDRPLVVVQDNNLQKSMPHSIALAESNAAIALAAMDQ